ncbi:fimbrial protein, partial [Providencia sp. TYF_10]
MFKKSLLALSLISLSGVALSAPVANLKVTGSITPPTCMVNGGEEADVLYQFDITPGIFPASG